MHIQKSAGGLAKRFDHGNADGNVGHKMAVHHVHMEPVRAGGQDQFNIPLKICKVGRKDRGGKHGHERVLLSTVFSGTAAGCPAYTGPVAVTAETALRPAAAALR